MIMVKLVIVKLTVAIPGIPGLRAEWRARPNLDYTVLY